MKPLVTDNTISAYKFSLDPVPGIIPISISNPAHRIFYKCYWYNCLVQKVDFNSIRNTYNFRLITFNLTLALHFCFMWLPLVLSAANLPAGNSGKIELYTEKSMSTTSTVVNDGDKFILFRCFVTPGAVEVWKDSLNSKNRNYIFTYTIRSGGDGSLNNFALYYKKAILNTSWDSIASNGYFDVEVPVKEDSISLSGALEVAGWPQGEFKAEAQFFGENIQGRVVIASGMFPILLKGPEGPYATMDKDKLIARYMSGDLTPKIEDKKLKKRIIKYYRENIPVPDIYNISLLRQEIKENEAIRYTIAAVTLKYKENDCALTYVSVKEKFSGKKHDIIQIMLKKNITIPCSITEEIRTVKAYNK